MVFVIDQAVRAKCIGSAVKTEHVAFAFVGIGVNRTRDEVVSSRHWD